MISQYAFDRLGRMDRSNRIVLVRENSPSIEKTRPLSMWFLKVLGVATLCLGIVVDAPADSVLGQEPFPFVVPGDDNSQTITNRSELLHRPAGKFGFVESREGHFYFEKSRQRFRMWGVNFCFGANFPTHDESDKLAPHLAKLGVNAVRIHHADNQSAPNGFWGQVIKGRRSFDPEMIDRFDYFLAKLHENGIYVDLNLHVSRELSTEEGYPVLTGGPWWSSSNKYVMYYDPDVQSELKRFCNELLSHENPYRNLVRAKDPGIAVVELLNENYFSEQGYSLVNRLPERFQKSLIAKWNEWLFQKYQSQETLMEAWKAGSESKIGRVLIPAAKWEKDLGGWSLNKSPKDLPRLFGTKGPKELEGSFALRVDPKEVSANDYEQQLLWQNLPLEKGEPITFTAWMKADRNRKLRIELSSLQGGEWRELGFFEDFEIGTTWQKIERVLYPKEDSKGDAYLAISFGNSMTSLHFAGISLQKGTAPRSIPSEQNLANKSIGIPNESFPSKAHEDMKSFMVDTERKWVRELKAYVKSLGVRVPITASQVNYHAPGIVEQELDFADLHNYWHHPMFAAGKEWSATDWTIENEPMEAGPTYSKWPANSLLMRTPWRVTNKPMTLSEWNYPEPSPFSAGCVPMAAVIAGLQDWDGVFFFDYEAFFSNGPSDRPFFKDHPTNFFSFNGAPAKLTAFSTFANVFLRGDLKPLEAAITSSPDKPFDGTLGFTYRLGVSRTSPSSPITKLPDDPNRLVTPRHTSGQSVAWTVETPMKKGFLQLQTEKTQGVWGTISGKDVQLSSLHANIGTIHRDYGLLVATACDDLPLQESERVLLLAATHTENPGMVWNEERTSVRSQWGRGPSQGYSIQAKIEWNWKHRMAKVMALDGTGAPVREVPSRIEAGKLLFEIGKDYQTMWYAITQ